MNVLGFHIGRANAAPAVAAPAEPTGGAGEAMAMAMMAALGHAAKSSEDAAGTPTGRATRLTKGLTPVKLAGYLDEFYAGNFRNIAQLWDTMEDGDTVCAPVAEKRKKKITGELRDYTVEAVDDTPAAEKQAEFLRTFLDSGIRGEHALRPAEHGGLRKAVEYMADAVGKKYSFLGKVWEQDGDQLKLTLRFVPLWHFKEADDGSYRYYPNPNSTLSSTAVKEEEWVIGVRSRAIMQAACLAVTLRRLPVQQVARALEKFGVPNVIGTTTAEFGSPGWDAMYTALVSYMSGMPALLSEGNDLNVLESSFRASALHKTHIEWCTTETVINWLGGELGTISKSGSGTLAGGAQSADLDDLIRDDCDWLTELINEQIVQQALAWRFPDQPMLAKFLLRKPDAVDDKADMATLESAVDLGAQVPISYAHERFGLPEAAPGDTVLTPAGDAPAVVAATTEADDTAATGAAIDDTAAIQEVALNGAQVTALLEVIQQVATEQLPRDSAIAIIVNAFGIEPDQAEALLGDVGRTFFVSPEEAATAKANAFARVRAFAAGTPPFDVRRSTFDVRRSVPRANASLPSRIRDRRPDLDQLADNALPPVGTAYAALLQPLLEQMESAPDLAAAGQLFDDYAIPDESLDAFAEVMAQATFCAAMMGLEPIRPGIPAQTIAFPNASPGEHQALTSLLTTLGFANADPHSAFSLLHSAFPRANANGEREYTPLPFDEAREFWEHKQIVTDYADLENMGMTWIESRVLGFRIAAITEQTTLERAHTDLARAVKGEVPVAKMVREMRDKYGLHTDYAETVVRTNVQSAYSWGNWQQLTTPSVVEASPLLAFDVVGDEDTSDICLPLEGKAYPREHVIWETLYPLNHFRCRTTVFPTDAEEAEEDGFTVEDAWPRNPNTGAEFMPQHGFEGNVGKVPLRDIAPGEIDAEKVKTAEIIGEGEVALAEERRQLVRDRLNAAGIPLEPEADRIPDPALETAVPPGFEVTNEGAHHDRSRRRIYLSDDPASWDGMPPTFHHEFGHHLHHETGAVTDLRLDPDFRDAVESDHAAWETRERERLGDQFETYYRAQAYSRASMTDYMVSRGVADGEVSAADKPTRLRVGGYFDIIGGMTKGKLGWGHERAYYRHLDGAHGLKDVYANCYCAIVMEQAEIAQEFPATMAYVQRSLGL